VDPADIARKDNIDVYLVETIIGHKTVGKSEWKRKSNMQFHVKWLGYTETTWEPWGNVKDTVAMVEYLTKMKKDAWIPRKITTHEEELIETGEP